MNMVPRFDKPARRISRPRLWIFAILALALAGSLLAAQTGDAASCVSISDCLSRRDVACYVSAAQSESGQTPQQKPPTANQKALPPEEPQTKITPEQGQELFRSVDEILSFVSKDTGLPIKSTVKRELAGRDQVRKYVQKHMQEDKDAQRLARSEASMKKFGLLPQEFDLRRLLLDLLEDQVAGYYDPKTKTVYLLDWLPPEQQRPVLAHELTHALQDQNFDLDKWLEVGDDQRDNPDNLDAGPDEEQSARQAVSEGQGMAAMMDYVLAPTGQTLADMPAMAEIFKQQTMERMGDSPILAQAPMYLREMVIFPYTYGLGFLQDLLTHGGKQMAFAGAFKNPPRDTREIMEPDTYLDGHHVAPIRLPNLTDVLKKNYVGYDSGAVGEFDVYILLKQYSGPELATKLSQAWRGGIYYLGRKKDAKPPTPDAPIAMSDLALLYVSNWATPEDAGYFAKAYSLWLPKKYKTVTPVAEQKGRAWNTEQGAVSIEVSGTRVLVMESFDATTAAALRDKVLSRATASAPPPRHGMAAPVWATLGILH